MLVDDLLGLAESRLDRIVLARKQVRADETAHQRALGRLVFDPAGKVNGAASAAADPPSQ